MDDRDPKNQGSGTNRPGKLELKKTVETGQVRQSFAHGRSKLVTVEVRKKRTYAPDARRPGDGRDGDRGRVDPRTGLAGLTNQEKAARVRALQDAIKAEEDRQNAPVAAKEQPDATLDEVVLEAEPFAGEDAPAADVAADLASEGLPLPVEAGDELQPEVTADAAAAPASAAEGAAPAMETAPPPPPPVAESATAEAVAVPAAEASLATPPAPEVKAPEGKPAEARAADKPGAPKPLDAKPSALAPGEEQRPRTAEDEAELARAKAKKAVRVAPGRPEVNRRDDARRGGRLSISEALEEGSERMRSLASVRRAREKERLKQLQNSRAEQKIVRDVIIPETLTVQELANRMAARSADVIKALMRMGVMATINHVIDADTAELLAVEFGHNVRRVSAADVEIGLKGELDAEQELVSRPAVVTVMGHVDHGKTSLLDALRKTDVAAHEAGGITQHIGAYQVTLPDGERITFIDTPGHAAFTQMRARGAKATDIVVLVVAADDGVMPQTVEAISHAKAANVPIIVAINKIDRPDANPEKIRIELLQYGIQVEETGGDVLSVPVSAKQGTNLDKLTEAILLQAEVLDLKSNPRRHAEGVIIESKVERGRGTVATVLVQRGTLHVGDIFVAGSEWGRVRGMTDAAGAIVIDAGPSMPVEVLGLNGTPAAGDDVVAVASEARAREITEFRTRRTRDAKVSVARGTFEQLLTRYNQGEGKDFSVVVKADVHGSAEAIMGTLEKIGGDQIKVNVLHAGVGGINETDVGLANASGALIIGFNVRANPQARELAKRDGVEIRYYSIIYELADDIRALLTGMLTPVLRERLLGYAEIREVFNITKVGKVAGCMITEGTVKRGARVRLLRENVVIHEGELSQLRRFKEDVREVREGFECGMALASYQDIQVGDRIECFEMEEVARQL